MMTTEEITQLYPGDWLYCSNSDHRWHTYVRMDVGPRITLWVGVVKYPDIAPDRSKQAPFRVFLEFGNMFADRQDMIKTVEETVQKAGELIAKQILIGEIVYVERLPDWLRSVVKEQLRLRLEVATSVLSSLDAEVKQ